MMARARLLTPLGTDYERRLEVCFEADLAMATIRIHH